MRSLRRFLLFVSIAAVSFGALAPAAARTDRQSPVAAATPAMPNVPGDEFWDDDFTLDGISGPVYAILRSGSFIYVGGDFHQVGDLPAENIAIWNEYTKSWLTVGSGVSGPVHAILQGPDGYLYVGGQFSQAGNVGAQNIARYTIQYGGRWENIGGASGPVYALARGDKYVYAGGMFSQAGYTVADNVARFDTAAKSWSALASGYSNGVSGPVHALAFKSNTEIYVGGLFTGIGGVSSVNAYNIARWNPTGKEWSEVNGSVGGPVYALKICGSELYVGGDFGQAGPLAAHNIASWNQTTQSWSALGTGVGNAVEAVDCIENRVYAGGRFTQAGGVAANHVAFWNPNLQAWSALGGGTSGDVFSIAADYSNGVYVGGLFAGAGTTGSHNIARFMGDVDSSNPEDVNWDTSFCARGGPNQYVEAIAASGDIYYYGGAFTSVGDLLANHLARYDERTNTWSAIGEGVDERVFAIATSGSDVYIGGGFTTAGGNPIAYIARWNSLDNTWDALGSGLNGHVNTIVIHGKDVFVGGGFTTAGDVIVNYVARWDTESQTWSPLGDGPQPGVNGAVQSLTISGGDLYAGGFFTQAQGQPVHYIARWNGSSWSSLGTGMSDWVWAVAEQNGYIYAGGGFSQAGGIEAQSIARWDGSSWQAMPGLTVTVFSVAFHQGDLYVGGGKSNYPSAERSIARWDGKGWVPLGSGVMGAVYALASGSKGLYVGGGFHKLENRLNCDGTALWKTASTPTGTGGISGGVHGPGGVLAPGATVRVCRPLERDCPAILTAGADGSYQAGSLPDGEYIVTAYPPQGMAGRPAASGKLVITGGASLQVDLNLAEISPLPEGTSLIPARATSAGVPLVNWRQGLLLKNQAHPGTGVTYQIMQNGASIASGPMVENPAGQYQAALPALYPVSGYVRVGVQLAGAASSAQAIDFDVYVDPGGTLLSVNGGPFAGATVTLFSYDPQTMSLAQVPADSPLLSPASQINPGLTDAAGHFGWDVATGTYVIRAEKEGCASPIAPYRAYAETGLLEAPFDLADLELRLNCPDQGWQIYLPAVKH